MKKFLVTILALVYFTTSIGANIHMHYCMGKLADSGLTKNTSTTCSKCGMDEKESSDKGCCHDKHQFLKNNSDQNTSSEFSFHLFQNLATAIPAGFIEMRPAYFSFAKEENPVVNDPPREDVAVYILNRTFLI